MAAAKITITAWSDCRPRECDADMVRGLVPRAAFGMLYGPSSSGKTFFAGGVAVAVGARRAFLGRRTRGGRTVYVAAENPGSVAARFAAWREHLGVAEADVLVLSGAIDVRNKSFFDALEGLAPALVVVDTLAAAAPGLDENDAQGMGAVIAACVRVRDRLGCTVLVVHHAGKDTSRGARGHSSLRAAVDFEIEVVAENGQRVARVTKSRDGVTDLEIGFRLRVLPIGQDADGEVMTTCCIEPAAATTAKQRRGPTGAIQKIVLASLKRLLATEGRLCVPGPSAPAVTIDRLRQELAGELGHLDGRHRSSRITEAVTALKAGGFIATQDDFVHLPEPSTVPAPTPESIRLSGVFGAVRDTDSVCFGDFGAAR